jgi:nucleobase:cation symporter-1, NCS1 family
MSVTSEEAALEFREGEYGDRIGLVEPGGIEEIPDRDRHGSPIQLLWTWTSPNLEFATVFIGVLAVIFGLSVWQAVAAIVIGNGLGALGQGVLSARGPQYGVPQMVLNRAPFGYRGNILPAGIMSITAGIGWFAVNSVSGTFALNSLTKLNTTACLLIVVAVQVLVAFFGHNLVQAFERYAFPLLAVVFVVASVISLSKSDFGAAGGGGGLGAFLLTVATVYGYSAGWNPFAADYSRYLPRDTDRRKVALYAFLGLFLSTTVLEIVGAASMSIVVPKDLSPTDAFVYSLPTFVAKLTLLCIVLGSICANVLNIYSGSLAFLTIGLNIRAHLRRAIVALGFGVLGFALAYYGVQHTVTSYENFLLLISYWLGPWLGIFLADQWVRRGARVDGLLFNRKHENWAAPVIFLVSLVLSVWLFSNQSQYTGIVPTRVDWIGDVTFVVGFVLAFVSYAVYMRTRRVVDLRDHIASNASAPAA